LMPSSWVLTIGLISAERDETTGAPAGPSRRNTGGRGPCFFVTGALAT
jgi:hypothetical protein